MTAPAVTAHRADWNFRHLAALLVANLSLAMGAWSVRLADCGPVSAGFWRLFLSLPVLFGFATLGRQRLSGYPRKVWAAIAGAGVIFALDLAAWHIGIGQTRLGNATLFANSGSLIVMVWGFVALRRLPGRFEWAALVSALAGAGILFGRSLEIGRATLVGDLFCLLGGFCYAFYIILAQGARNRVGSWALLAWSSLVSSPVLLGIAVLHGEPVWPHVWWPLLTLTLGSQIIGQGLLVYSLRHFPPLVIGLVLLLQPAVAILSGWVTFGETVTLWDCVGMALVAAALVIARAEVRD